MKRMIALVLAAVLVAVGLVGFWRSHQLRNTDAARNLALTDATLTSQVQSQVSKDLVNVLSYDYSDPAPTQQAAATVLVGPAREQYDTLFKTLQDKAPGQKLVLSAEVQSVAVKTLSPKTATLLVFLDQSSQRATDKQASVSAAQLQVHAALVDGQWKVTDLKPL